VAGRVEPQCRRSSRGARGRPAHQGLQPDDELAHVEGLGQVLVAARGVPGQQVVQLVAGGQEEHRDVDAPGPQRLADVPAVGVGQPDVQDDGGEPGGRAGAGGGQGRRAVDRGGHRQVLLAQRAGDGGAQRGVVLDDQYLGHGCDGA
jgi:hypothetical protein